MIECTCTPVVFVTLCVLCALYQQRAFLNNNPSQLQTRHSINYTTYKCACTVVTVFGRIFFIITNFSTYITQSRRIQFITIKRSWKHEKYIKALTFTHLFSYFEPNKILQLIFEQVLGNNIYIHSVLICQNVWLCTAYCAYISNKRANMCLLIYTFLQCSVHIALSFKF